MRVLSAMKLCEEVGDEEYKANPVTEALASPSFDGGTKYMSVTYPFKNTGLRTVRKPLLNVTIRTDSFLPISAKLTDFMYQSKFQNPEEKSPFEFTFDTNLWSYLAQNPTMQKNSMHFGCYSLFICSVLSMCWKL